MNNPQTPIKTRRAGPAHPRLPGSFRSAGLALCLILASVPGLQAAESEENRGSAKAAPKTATATQPPKPKPKAPRTFVPTEKIKADSIVSFPVDI